jgi:hypothetical protein
MPNKIKFIPKTFDLTGDLAQQAAICQKNDLALAKNG